jgi:hypothetical protein
MVDLYLLAVVRAREIELRRETELAHQGRARAPRDVRQQVGRSRIVLAQWLIAVAERLWPEAGRRVMGEAR